MRLGKLIFIVEILSLRTLFLCYAGICLSKGPLNMESREVVVIVKVALAVFYSPDLNLAAQEFIGFPAARDAL